VAKNIQDIVIAEVAKRLKNSLDVEVFPVDKDENKTFLIDKLRTKYANEEAYRFGVLSVRNVAINTTHYSRKGADTFYRRLGTTQDNKTIISVPAIPVILSVDLEVRVETYEFAFKMIHRLLKMNSVKTKNGTRFNVNFKGIEFPIDTIHETTDINIDPIVEEDVERYTLMYPFKITSYLTDLDKSPIVRENNLDRVYSNSGEDAIRAFAQLHNLTPDFDRK
jgi:ribosomal protein L23